MLENYKIIKTNNDEILYLYLNINYEFGNDFKNNDNEEDLERKAINYLTTHNIEFKGNKIVYVINGITTKIININKNKAYLNKYLININTE